MSKIMYTREQVEAQLAKLGWVFVEEPACEWRHADGRRGRLTWQPDYSQPERTDIGSKWWLTPPNKNGKPLHDLVPIMGFESD